MAANWTDKQKQAIYVSGRSSLVAAAAGSGKTAVLVERIIKKITDENHPVDIDRLVVVTFTKAAAAESSIPLLVKHLIISLRAAREMKIS